MRRPLANSTAAALLLVVLALIAVASPRQPGWVGAYRYDSAADFVARSHLVDPETAPEQGKEAPRARTGARSDGYNGSTNLALASVRPGEYRLAPNTAGGSGRTFTHFTDEAGATGITGTRPLSVGERVEVGQLAWQGLRTTAAAARAAGQQTWSAVERCAGSSTCRGIAISIAAIALCGTCGIATSTLIQGGAGFEVVPVVVEVEVAVPRSRPAGW